MYHSKFFHVLDPKLTLVFKKGKYGFWNTYVARYGY